MNFDEQKRANSRGSLNQFRSQSSMDSGDSDRPISASIMRFEVESQIRQIEQSKRNKASEMEMQKAKLKKDLLRGVLHNQKLPNPSPPKKPKFVVSNADRIDVIPQPAPKKMQSCSTEVTQSIAGFDSFRIKPQEDEPFQAEFNRATAKFAQAEDLLNPGGYGVSFRGTARFAVDGLEQENLVPAVTDFEESVEQHLTFGKKRVSFNEMMLMQEDIDDDQLSEVRTEQEGEEEEEEDDEEGEEDEEEEDEEVEEEEDEEEDEEEEVEEEEQEEEEEDEEDDEEIEEETDIQEEATEQEIDISRNEEESNEEIDDEAAKQDSQSDNSNFSNRNDSQSEIETDIQPSSNKSSTVNSSLFNDLSFGQDGQPLNSPSLLVFDNDSERVREKKRALFERKIKEREQELQRRQTELQMVRESPRLPPGRFSPAPMRKNSQEPLRNQNVFAKRSPSSHTSTDSKQSDPKSIFEETKSVQEKYRRHKNLPKLSYKKHSNRQLIVNAIERVCLAGEPNKTQRDEVLEIIDKNPEINYLVILFKGQLGRRDIWGLYAHEVGSGHLVKIFQRGTAPDIIDSTDVQAYYRYNSGSREFQALSCNNLIAGVDAVVLKHKVKRPTK